LWGGLAPRKAPEHALRKESHAGRKKASRRTKREGGEKPKKIKEEGTPDATTVPPLGKKKTPPQITTTRKKKKVLERKGRRVRQAARKRGKDSFASPGRKRFVHANPLSAQKKGDDSVRGVRKKSSFAAEWFCLSPDEKNQERGRGHRQRRGTFR